MITTPRVLPILLLQRLDRCWFKTYQSLNDRSILHIGNESTALVHGRGCVDLRFSIGKIVSLFNVLHVPNIRKNLISCSILNNYGYKQVIESNKFVLSKHAFMSTSKLNDSILWHARLGHVHYKRMQDMSQDGLIPAFNKDTKKLICVICMLLPSLGNKKYFVTFIDDASRAVVRLLDPKMETLGERGIECMFVGYTEHFKAFRFSSVSRPSQSFLINGTEDIGGSVVPEKVTEEVDETIENFKARLVLQDFRQKSRIDYFHTYAQVARISTIRLLVALASIHNLIIHQMDVKTTFLNGELDEEAPKKWHQKFNEVVLSIVIYLTKLTNVDLTKEFLSSKFSMKDIREADVILGIRIKHGSNGIAISQFHYIEKVLKKFNYFDCTLVCTLMDTSEKLVPNNGQAVSQLKYSNVIGCLVYAITCTRPDIAFVVGKLSRYTSNPSTRHWQAIQRVLKYLKKTKDYSLIYTGDPSVLEGYTDACWINNTEDNLSISGWVFLLGGAASKEAE
ncbi:zinc finger, CCHC-type containing protein [Tanacetum coccineum]